MARFTRAIQLCLKIIRLDATLAKQQMARVKLAMTVFIIVRR